MLKEKRLNLMGQLLLLSATMAWGVSFTFLKDIIETVSMYYVIGVRFVVASAILALIFIKRFGKMNKGTFLRGLILGAVLTLAYLTQTYGLNNTTPGENAFLTSTYNVMIPFMLWAIYKRRPKPAHLIAAVLCLVGISFIAFSNNGEAKGNAVVGYGLTVLAAIFFAFQILIIDVAKDKGDDTFLTLILELAVVGVVFSVLSLIIDAPKGIGVYALGTEQIVMLLVLTFICTLYAQFAQIRGMHYTHPTQAALILSLESVFGTVFSLIMGREHTSALMFAGFILIFVAIVVSELDHDEKKTVTEKPRNDENP